MLQCTDRLASLLNTVPYRTVVSLKDEQQMAHEYLLSLVASLDGML